MQKRKSSDLLNEFSFKKPKMEPEAAAQMDLDCRGSEPFKKRRDGLVLDPTLNENLHNDIWKALKDKIAEQKKL